MTTSERRLRKVIGKWVKILGLDDWDIGVELVPETDNIDAGFESVADCLAYWEYERAQIRFNDSYVSECDDAQLERTVLHELLHCSLNEIRHIDNPKAEECTTVMLTRAFMRVAA